MGGGMTKKMKSTVLLMGAVLTLSAVDPLLQAQDAARESITVFSNVRIFDGKSSQLSPASNVLVRGNKIEKISTSPIPADRRADTTFIDGKGRTLMPGLIDAHWHAMMAATPMNVLMTADIG